MAKGDAAVAPERSTVNDQMIKSTGDSAIKGDPPGTFKRVSGVVFEGLGNLDEFPDLSVDSDEGVGELCVVLSDFLSGANQMTYVKGDIRPLSKFIQGYEDKKVSRELVKGQIKRFFEMGALRQATREEKHLSHIDISDAGETDEVQQERAKRIEAERELERLRQQYEPEQESAGTKTGDEEFDS